MAYNTLHFECTLHAASIRIKPKRWRKVFLKRSEEDDKYSRLWNNRIGTAEAMSRITRIYGASWYFNVIRSHSSEMIVITAHWRWTSGFLPIAIKLITSRIKNSIAMNYAIHLVIDEKFQTSGNKSSQSSHLKLEFVHICHTFDYYLKFIASVIEAITIISEFLSDGTAINWTATT